MDDEEYQKLGFIQSVNLGGVVDVDRVIGWLQNFQVNLKTIGFKSVSDLPKIEGSALVIDKSMASTKFFEQIHHLKDYHGVIICCDRALYQIIPYIFPSKEDKLRVVETQNNYSFISPNGTRPPDAPTYVCNLDSSSLCLSFFDRPDVKRVMDKVTAVFSVTTNPLTIRHFHGKRYFFTPYMMGLTDTLQFKSGTPYIRTGGQVASFAWVLAYALGAKTIGTFGITHSFDSMAETEYPGAAHERIEGLYGTCWQDQTYRFYNDTYLKLIREGKKDGVETINCSKAGLLYNSNVIDMSLQEYVEKYE
uniref:6-hydroxymethylpterin diphosphokinase MptE-like domain-containing protein n=1 Tax=viral metagenome TaxID=1070528 RepID=A0A6M3LCT5_9ZZZZ